MQRILILALVALVPLAVVAQERQHQQSAAGTEHPYEVLSADGWVVRLHRFTGATAMLGSTNQGREVVWRPIEHPELPATSAGQIRYQLIRSDRSQTRWLLLDQRTGRTWLLRSETNALREVSFSWSAIAEAPVR